MKIYRIRDGFVIEKDSSSYQVSSSSGWDEIINRDDLYDYLDQLISTEAKRFSDFHPLAPIWKSGSLGSGRYLFFKPAGPDGRIRDAGGGDFYSRVYGADRPEIFFKATAAEP